MQVASQESESAAVSLERYVGIVVAMDEGHDLAKVLAQEQVAEDAWGAIDLEFKDRLSRDGELFSEYARKVAEAEDVLQRTVAPLHEEPAAYLAFVRAFAEGDAAATLATHALRLADLSRLGRHWQGRFAEDEQLRDEAFEQAQHASPPVDIQVAEAELRTFPWTPGALPTEITAPHDDDSLARTLDPSTLPSAFGPPVRQAHADFFSRSPVLPPHRPSRLEPNPLMGATDNRAPARRAAPKPGSDLEPVSTFGLTQSVDDGPRAAPVPFRGRRTAPVNSPLEPHPELGMTASLDGDVAFGQCDDPATPFASPEPVGNLGSTAPLGGAPAQRALPFAGEGRAPNPVALEPHPEMGNTLPLGETASTPTSDAPSPDAPSPDGPSPDKPTPDKRHRDGSVEPYRAPGGTVVISPDEEPT